ncbi:DNA replication and repair protein RecF [Patescibacteria group bacterium]|nr:DNA replication and repair protein RecF [Patescibacteria group bacterium]
MLIQKVRLNDFRNFKTKLFEFSPKTTVIIGPNASGKTNILESLFLLSTGKSFHARVEEEMVNYDADLARVKGRVKTDGAVVDLETVLTRGFLDIGKSAPEKIAKKRLLVNGVGKRLIDFAGNFRVTLFGPWDLDLVTESPTLRRRFMDTVISQVDREYRRASLSYEKGLRQRNRLLLRIREEGISRSQLLFWNKLLVKNGDYISLKRQEFIDFANATQGLNTQKFELEYDKSAISEARLEQYTEEEVAAATTLVGPHRDDFCFFTEKKRDLSRFGSRGEQRMGTLWLKIAELEYIEHISGERPTLLLDDIFSELDDAHREVVMKTSNSQQTIITTADPHFTEKLKKLEKISLP